MIDSLKFGTVWIGSRVHGVERCTENGPGEDDDGKYIPHSTHSWRPIYDPLEIEQITLFSTYCLWFNWASLLFNVVVLWFRCQKICN